MTRYQVSFFKDVLSSNGYPFKCIQQVIEIRRARSADRAVQAAELRYERLLRVHDWMLHADCLELEIDGKKVDYCSTGIRATVAGKTPFEQTSSRAW
jgi:hypothetical protein